MRGGSVARGAVAAGAVWLGVEAHAHACSCLEGDSDLVAPAIAEHPAGAPFVFESFCNSGLERWTATVDGVPVELVGTGVDFGLALVTLASIPTEGAEVVLTHACGEYTDEVDYIDGYLERVTVTIVPADVDAPPPVASLTIEHEVGMLSNLCGDPEVHALRVSSVLEIGDREPGTWAVVRAVVDDEVIASEDAVLGELATLQVSLFIDEPDQYAGREVCVEVQVVDASGNASDTTRECTTLEDSVSSGCAITGRLPGPALLLLGLLVSRPRRRFRISP